jgi:phosphoribosylanthranilate isomerase
MENASDLGATHVGLVMAGPSSRHAAPKHPSEIISARAQKMLRRNNIAGEFDRDDAI